MIFPEKRKCEEVWNFFMFVKIFYLSGCIFSKKIYLILCWNL